MKNKFIVIRIALFFLFLPTYLTAQKEINIKFGKLSAADFDLPSSPVIDANTQAVIIANIGNTEFVGNNDGWLSYVFTRKTRIKILNKNALDVANIEIELRQKENGEHADKLTELSAVTYNLENGKVVETALSKNEVFVETLSKRRFRKKFALPAVKEGSIIEYSYKITSYFYYWLPEWQFQNTQYPCLWSEFKINIPSILGYSFSRRGFDPFYIDQASEGRESYNVIEKDREGRGVPDRSLNVATNTIKRRWVIKDVPPFKIETYISNAEKYIDMIDFQLIQTYNGEDVNEIYNTWAKATEQLLKDNEFAATLNEENEWMNKILEQVLQGESDQLQRAKKIYDHVIGNFACTDYHNPYLTSSLYDVTKKKSGTVGDINLLLISMLKKAGITASPVLLSTREYGFSDPKYPLIDKLDYVICRCRIQDKSYNLDAAYSFLGFGNLPLNCYNGYAKVISRTDSSFLYLDSDSIRERQVTIVSMVNNEKEKGTFAGSIKISEGYFKSNQTRATVIKNGKAAFITSIKAGYGNEIEMENAKIDSLQIPGEGIEIFSDFKMKPDLSGEIFYFNPAMFFKSYGENPFKSDDRKYPVEMNYPVDETYVFSMEVPDGYTVDELPKSAKILFHEKDGFFQYQIAKTDNTIQFMCMIKLRKATFSAEEYADLREFFSYVVKKRSEQIVFKRKK